MKRKTHIIESVAVKIVTNKCPLGVFGSNHYNMCDRKLESCEECRFFQDDSLDKCAYDLYETRLIKHDEYTDPDDGSGALPSTDYMWNFKCAKCGEVVRFYSGFSVLSSGDYQDCNECGTHHRYISQSNGIHFFAIPTSKGSDNDDNEH